MTDPTAQTFNPAQQLPPPLHRRTNWRRHRGICDVAGLVFYCPTAGDTCPIFGEFFYCTFYIALICVSFFHLFARFRLVRGGFCSFVIFSWHPLVAGDSVPEQRSALTEPLYSRQKNCLHASISQILKCICVYFPHTSHTMTFGGENKERNESTVSSEELFIHRQCIYFYKIIVDCRLGKSLVSLIRIKYL